MGEGDKIYLAGFFDGEGCVTIRYGKQYDTHYISVSISQNDKEILEWVAENYGGKVYPSRHDNSVCYEWILYRKDDIVTFLNDIIPSLRIKKEQALIGLRFCETINKDGVRGRTDDNFREQRILLKEELANSRLVH